MKSMNQMREQVFATYRNTPKDKDGYPKLKTGGMGCVWLVWNKEQEKQADFGTACEIIVGMIGVVFAIGLMVGTLIFGGK